jgi:MoxR-like ATPase
MAKLDNMKLRPSDVKGAMRGMFAANKPAFIWGPPGIGKSAIMLELANETPSAIYSDDETGAPLMGVAFVDVRLSQMDPTDIRGMPYKVEEEGVTTGVAWSPPLIFPLDIDKVFNRFIEAIPTRLSFKSVNPTGTNGIHYCRKPSITATAINPDLKAVITAQTPENVTVKLVDKDGVLHAGKVNIHVEGEVEAILAFEEMNSAPPSVLAACYQVIHDRRIGDFELGRLVRQVAMGNREDDRGVSFKMPTPLMNRFGHLEMAENFRDWQTWAVRANVSPDVVGFLSAFENKMFDFNPGSGARGFPTPRSWKNTSDRLKSDAPTTDTQLMATIYGFVGDAAGAEFFEFRKIAQSLPTPHDVLSGRVTKLGGESKNRTALSFALTTSLLYVLKKADAELVSQGIEAESKDKKRNEWYSMADFYIQFALDNFKPDVNVMGIRSALQTHGLPINGMRCKNWTQFVRTYKDVMMDGG